MRSIKMFGLAVVAVLAFSVVAVASASAEEFTASVVGAKLTGKALNTQIFTDKTNGSKVECTEDEPTSSAKASKSVEEEVSVQYKSCKVFGLGAAKISLAEYTFLTSSSVMGGPGNSILTKPITIEVTTFPKCTIVVSSGQAFKAAGEIAYSNKTTSTIEIKANVKGIASEVTLSESSSLCGTVGEKNTTGTYTGNSEVGEVGGSIQIK